MLAHEPEHAVYFESAVLWRRRWQADCQSMPRDTTSWWGRLDLMASCGFLVVVIDKAAAAVTAWFCSQWEKFSGSVDGVGWFPTMSQSIQSRHLNTFQYYLNNNNWLLGYSRIFCQGFECAFELQIIYKVSNNCRKHKAKPLALQTTLKVLSPCFKTELLTVELCWTLNTSWSSYCTDSQYDLSVLWFNSFTHFILILA